MVSYAAEETSHPPHGVPHINCVLRPALVAGGPSRAALGDRLGRRRGGACLFGPSRWVDRPSDSGRHENPAAGELRVRSSVAEEMGRRWRFLSPMEHDRGPTAAGAGSWHIRGSADRAGLAVTRFDGRCRALAYALSKGAPPGPQRSMLPQLRLRSARDSGSVSRMWSRPGMQHRAQRLNMLRQSGVNPLPPSSVAKWLGDTQARTACGRVHRRPDSLKLGCPPYAVLSRLWSMGTAVYSEPARVGALVVHWHAMCVGFVGIISFSQPIGELK
jgi:hypothetical protein